MIRSIVAASLLLAGCTATVVDTSCTAFRPITYCGEGCTGQQDSQATKAQVKEHNAAWARLCGK